MFNRESSGLALNDFWLRGNDDRFNGGRDYPMKKEFKFPDVGEGITEGELVKWLVSQGESVKEDQPLVEVETDKAVVTLPSPYTGKIVEQRGKPGRSFMSDRSWWWLKPMKWPEQRGRRRRRSHPSRLEKMPALSSANWLRPKRSSRSGRSRPFGRGPRSWGSIFQRCPGRDRADV